ncbi:MAG TPA: hypothetical protein VFJ14_13040 [Nocardioidaceae bacterium]|nr:hypothetical protein [Nocardioidaceae bacterium]
MLYAHVDPATANRRRTVRRITVTVVVLLAAITLATHVVLYAIKPRPFMDPSAPWYVMGPHCGDADIPVSQASEKQAINPACRHDWQAELLGRTYTRATWPQWPWELL